MTTAGGADSAGRTSAGRQLRPPPEPGFMRIQPGRRWVARLPEVWEYRDVLYFLLVRNLKVRYRQTVLGAAWALAQPLALTAVLVIVAQKLIKVSSGGVPYVLFAFSALVPWTLFSQALTLAAESVVKDINLVAKVYVPRMILPLAAIGALVVDFVIALLILLVLMVAYHRYPQPSAALWVPLLTVLALAVALAVGYWLSALMVMYRDVRAITPLLVQIWLFATPVAYPTSLVPEKWRLVYGLNPMAGVVEGFRSALLGEDLPSRGMLAVSTGITVLLLVAGITYFRRTERLFADII
jgi:lipopolysaccharide transport system permease protein